jgi:hypothetical protein
MDEAQVKKFAEGIADYVATNDRYEELDKRQAVIEAVMILGEDIGAAQDFLRIIGVDIDLYDWHRTSE